jgi:membrane-associated phospholipid phosphatase
MERDLAKGVQFPLSGTTLRRFLLAFGMVVPSADPLLAQGAEAKRTSAVLLTRRDALLGAGALAGAVAISFFDPKIGRFFQDTTLSHVRIGDDLDDIFTHINETTLTVGSLLTYGVGRLTKSSTIIDIGAHATEAIVGASLTAQLIRGPLGRSRPRVTGYEDQYDFSWFKGFKQFNNRAFPSIHSTSGFAVAAVLAAETKRRAPGAFWYVAPVVYGLALTPGLSRMYLGQHWASDVFAGAFLGTFAGLKIVSYTHDHPNNRVDRFLIPGARNLRLEVGERAVGVGWRGEF